MNNLIVFGDSFSTHYTTNDSVNIEDSWPKLLSKKLGLELINHSLIGGCNGEILNKFFKEYECIKKDDIIILEIGFFNRLLDQFKNTTIHLEFDERFDELDFQFFSRKVLNMDEYIRQDIIKYAFICEYLKQRGNKFYLWCLDRELSFKDEPTAYNEFNSSIVNKFYENLIKFKNKYSLMDVVIEKNPKFWVNNSDKHFNKLGHEYFFLYLYGVITGTQIKELI